MLDSINVNSILGLVSSVNLLHSSNLKLNILGLIMYIVSGLVLIFYNWSND